MMLCKMLLRQKPSFLTSPATHYLSTEALQSTNEDGGGEGILCSLNSTSNPKSSSNVVGLKPDLDKIELTKTLLKRYGFTNAQLSKLYTDRPTLFTSNPEKTLLPKLDFYRCTVGFSNTDLPRFICCNPALLTYSLRNNIVPVYNFIKGLLLSDEIVLKTLKRSTRLIGYSFQERIAPGISALREAGVPHKQILYLMRNAPTSFGSLSLGESMKRATEMGFDPNKLSFVEAIKVFTQMSNSTWDKKMEVYRKCGLSDEEILVAFRLRPYFMTLSERNIVQTMDFVVNEMGWLPVDVARNPIVLSYSLEKRTIPRCTVVRYLQGKGLLKKSISFSSFLPMKEKDFIGMFVKKYEDDVSDLMDIYLGKISPPPQEPIP